jgi:hypothetical protein
MGRQRNGGPFFIVPGTANSWRSSSDVRRSLHQSALNLDLKIVGGRRVRRDFGFVRLKSSLDCGAIQGRLLGGFAPSGILVRYADP